MWTIVFLIACSSGPGAELPSAAVEARDRLASALLERDPAIVGPRAEEASMWEGQDPALDRLLGDALSNVLMSPADGLRLLRSSPDPSQAAWREAIRSAALRTGEPETIRGVWSDLGEPLIPAGNPVLGQVVQRMLADPSVDSNEALAGLFGCQLLDAQPAVGRKEMDHPIGSSVVDVIGLLGVDQVTVGRPMYRSDPDPQSGRGPLQCTKKVLLSDGWPEPMPKTVTVALRQGDRTAFIDIRNDAGQPWAYAASDARVGDRILRSWVAFEAGKADELSGRYPDGLWASAAENAQ